MIHRIAFAVVLTVVAVPFASPAAEPPGKLAFDVPPGAKLSFGGDMGVRIDRNVDHWLLRAPIANPGMLEMFRVRDRKPEPQIVPWAGEFAGKYLISAIQALRMTERPDLESHVRRFVDDLVATQAEDGYLGPFPKRDRLRGNWDLWGHYHVMQGLLLWHERTGDERALQAAARAADLICGTYLDAGRRVFDAGSHEMNMAVIHVLGWLYRLTSNERYLRMMREIETDWERAGDYFRQGLAGVEFFRTPRPRWESLHDLQGLVELYRITGDERYKAAFVNLWRSIQRLDRHNTGGFSSGEQAVGHPYSPAAIETCCTIAWMAITVDMLRLTGDPLAADELELSTLNGMLGAQHPSGRWWTYSTPMDGAREASAHSIVFQSRAGTPELNCCSVNGPRGLGMLSEWAVMADAQGVVLNYLGAMKATVKLKDGMSVQVEEAPGASGGVEVVVRPEREMEFTLRLRIPAWSRETRVLLWPEQKSESPRAGEYFVLNRQWKAGDRISVQTDDRLRAVAGDRNAAGKLSLYRGPILLAYDQRLNPFDDDALPALDAAALLSEQPALPVVPGDELGPQVLVGLKGAKGERITLCDYASAGAAGTRYRSWLPAVNVPPPPIVLDRPRAGEKVPPGKVVFTWGWRRKPPGVDEYELHIGTPWMKTQVAARSTVPRVVVDRHLKPGHTYTWFVVAKGPHGTSFSELHSVEIDPNLPPLSEAALGAPGPGPDGVLVAAPLHGDAKPSFGTLQDAAGVEPAAGSSGEAATALALDGEKGRVRYAIPFFPERDYSVVVRFALRAFPEKRIAQVFSAWAAGSDDPLRITVDGGKLFARIETPGGSYSTQGVPLEAGKWIHAAAVKAGTKLALFVDGEERASVQVPEEIQSEAQNVALGGNPNYGGNEFLAASLADFTLHARALSAEEVRKLAR